MKPMEKIPVVFSNAARERCLVELEWGFVPEWDHDLTWRGRLYNIRSETLIGSLNREPKTGIRRAYVEAISLSRCLIPVAEAFERSREDGAMYKLTDPSAPFLSIAGLYSRARVSDKEELGTVGLITRGHFRFGRIPLILPDSTAIDSWLDPNQQDKGWAVSFLRDLGYTDQDTFIATRERKPCVEPSPELSPQTRLSLL